MTTDLLPMAPANGTAKNEHCDCTEDGHCARYNRQMVGRLRAICRGEAVDPGEAAKYRALWLAEKHEKAGTTPGNTDCPHRTPEPLKEGKEKKVRKCPSCTGNVRQILYGCSHPALAPHETILTECAVCAYRPKPKTGTRSLILKNSLCPGDVLVMSAAIYSLHRAHPGKFLTAVETTAMQLWEHNPDVVPTGELTNATTLEAHYPLVNASGQRAVHFIQGYHDYLGDALGVRIPVLTNRPHIYLSAQEKSWMNQVEEITKKPTRFWLVNSGHKKDYTTKAWGTASFQRVVDLLRGRITFVQVGESGHNHPPLKNVINLVGKTDTRQLVRLAYHSQGILTGVSFPMHLAAALEKPCVAIMGGREPTNWNQYPRMQLMHTVGALDCCRDNGCWRSRVVPLGDNDEKDKSLCEHVIPGEEPVGKCMALISPESVAEAVLRYQS